MQLVCIHTHSRNDNCEIRQQGQEGETDIRGLMLVGGIRRHSR